MTHKDGMKKFKTETHETEVQYVMLENWSNVDSFWSGENLFFRIVSILLLVWMIIS